MQTDSHENGVRTIWLDQPTEKPTMISKLIEQSLRKLRAESRRGLIGTVAGPLGAGFLCAHSMKAFPALRQVLQPFFAIAVSWGLAGVYFLNRGVWSAVMPGDMGPNTGLEACRLEVERQRDRVRRSLVWLFGPVMLAAATFILALALVSTRNLDIFSNARPFLIVLVVWIVSWFVIRSREQRALQREIGELKALEIGNRSFCKIGRRRNHSHSVSLRKIAWMIVPVLVELISSYNKERRP